MLRLNADKIAITGSSAGGHLAALVGVTNGHPGLEGTIGAHLGQSSAVQAIVSFYGASDLRSILGQSTEFGLTVRVPALRLLPGDLPEKTPELARLASPMAHLDKADPPLLLIHEDEDPQMPPRQSADLRDAQLGRASLITLRGSRHGGPEFYDEERMAAVARFLKEALKSR